MAPAASISLLLFPPILTTLRAMYLSDLTLTLFFFTDSVPALAREEQQRMKISEVSTIDEAICYLEWLTKRPWSSAEFTREILRLHLPIYGAAPIAASIESRRLIDGRLKVEQQPAMSAHYVTLLQAEIEELAQSPGPRIVTDRPAWLWGDTPYQPWDQIAAFRAANHRVLNYWEVEEGEWMGQSDEYFFSAPVQVTADSTLVVPRHTIAEVVRNFQGKQEKLAMPCTSMSAPSGPEDKGCTDQDDGFARSLEPLLTPDTVDLTKAVPEAAAPMIQSASTRPKAHIWDQHGLRRLLEESWMPGATHTSLAKKYGVSRQFITKQLSAAKKLFERPKANPFSALTDGRRTK